MGIMNNLHSLVRTIAGSDNLGDRRETDNAIETIVAQTVPKIRAVGGYKRRLRDAVATSLAYARQLVDSLGEPVTIEPRLASRDPLVGAFFSSHEEASHILSGVPAMDECFFLMSMVRQERRIIGSVLDGEIVRKGVIQVSETFTNHEILAASPSLEDTRRKLVDVIIQFLSRRAAENIARTLENRAELNRSKEFIKAELHTLQLTAASLPRMSDARAKADRAMADMEQEIRRLDHDINSLSPHLGSLDDYLEHTRQVLSNPQGSLTIERISMRLNDFGIKVDNAPDQPGSVVSFIEAIGRDERRAVVLARMSSRGVEPEDSGV